MVSYGGAVGVFAWVDKGEGLSWFEGWGIGMVLVLCGMGIGSVCMWQFISGINCHVFIDRRGFIC